MFLFLSLLTAAAPTHQITQPQLFHADEAPQDPAGEWLALVPRGETWSLVPVQVKAQKAHDAVLDEEGQATGVALSVEGVEPLVLLRGLEPRAGIQGTVPEGGSFLLGQLLPLGDYTLGTYGTVLPGDAHNTVHKDVSMALTWQGGTQTLFTLPSLNDAHPRLVFAGDLDGDGVVDLILDETWHYNLGQLSLWLSSAAEPGQRLGRVAMQESTGC